MFGKGKEEVVENHPLPKRNESLLKRQGFFWNQGARSKNSNAIDVDGGTKGPIKCYNYSKLDHIAKQYWYKGGNIRRIKEEKMQEVLKENRSQ